jgi:hypothetical protein
MIAAKAAAVIAGCLVARISPKACKSRKLNA